MGLLGIVLTSSLLLARLLRTESLRRPYLFPFYPTRPTDWKDSIIRLPISAMFRRPIFSRSKQRFRFNPEEVEKIKLNHEMILMIEINREEHYETDPN